MVPVSRGACHASDGGAKRVAQDVIQGAEEVTDFALAIYGRHTDHAYNGKHVILAKGKHTAPQNNNIMMLGKHVACCTDQAKARVPKVHPRDRGV